MRYLDFACDTPADYLACEEVLLDACESGRSDELLWCWEPRAPFIVLGYSNPVRSEVNVPACRARGVPLLRRISGGGTVLQGPGCVNFSLYLDLSRTACAGPSLTTAFVLDRHRQALAGLLPQPLEIQGGDLALGGRKCSGSAQRRRQRYALFHGTFLLSVNLELMDAVLPMPSHQPAYRNGRAHREFLTSLPLTTAELIRSLRAAWSATALLPPPSASEIRRLADAKYGTAEWAFKR